MISLFSFLLFLVFVFVTTSAIFIFGDSPSFRNTPVHKLRTGLVVVFRNTAGVYNHVDTHYCNGKLAIYLNGLVPIGYLGVVTFCLDQFFRKTYPIIQNLPQGANNLYIAFSIGLIYLATYLGVFSDPGDVTLAPPSVRSRFKNNQLIFFDGKTCGTCNIVKPARSKHCSVCKRCFLLFDHHCIWINNCVGYYNYRWFLLFLFANVNFLSYGGYICFQALQSERAKTTGSYWQVIKGTTDANKVSGIFVILCFLLVIITSLFTGLQLRYVYLGVTTNELEKWSEIEHLVHLGALYQLVGATIRNESYLEEARTRDNQVVYISLLDSEILIDTHEVSHYQLKNIVSVEHDLVNGYDNGFWNNLKERLLI